MKRLLTTIAVLGAMTTAANSEITFQKTYEVPGMTATEIKTAFGDLRMTQADSKIDQLGTALKLIQLKKPDSRRQEYPVKCVWMSTSFYFDGDVILQAREGKYRLTVSNLRDADNGSPIQTMAKSMEPKCAQQIEQWADGKFQQVKKLAF